VVVEQVGAVDVSRLGDLVGHLSPEEQWGIDAALLTVFGLS
jgi:mRNA-degrading endonuclease toxin of MazEF toxin-antitoxin module